MPKIQVRRGTSSQWVAANPVLAAGEFGYETDTGRFKIGDGNTAWNAPLTYAKSGALTPSPYSLTISNAFSNSGTWNGSSALTLDLPSTIARNAQTASKLQSSVTINGTAFDGSANISVGGALFQPTGAFKNVVVSPTNAPPASPENGLVWIAYTA